MTGRPGWIQRLLPFGPAGDRGRGPLPATLAVLVVAALGVVAASPDWRPTLVAALSPSGSGTEVELDEDAAAASRQAAGDAGGRGDTERGATPDTGFTVTDDRQDADGVSCASAGCVRWSLALGPRDRLAADDGQVVVATSNRILAVDVATARGRWQVPLPPGGDPISTVHLLGDVVLLARHGALEMRSLADGGTRWSRALDVGDITDVQRLGDTVVVTAGVVPDLPGAGVLALDTATGGVRWTREALDVRRPVVRVDGPHLAVQTSARRIVGIDPTTGRSRWVRAGRVGFTDAAVLLAAPDGRVERLVAASGGSGAALSADVGDALTDGPWTVIRDADGTSRLVDERGRIVDQRRRPALALAGTDAGALVAYRDGDDVEVVRYDDTGALVDREPLPGGVDVWGIAPRLGLADGTRLVISQGMRRTLRLTDPSSDSTADATIVDDWPLGTSTTTRGAVLVAAHPEAVELRGGGDPVRIGGRLRRADQVADDLLIHTDDRVVQLAGASLGP